jgi:hypothetical protein
MVGLAAAGAVVHWLTGRTHLAVLAIFVLALSLWQFFVPAGYEMDVRGVERRLFGRRRRIPWAAIRRYMIGRGGVTIVRHGDGRPTDALLATHLPWGNRREEVLGQIRYYLGPPSE